MSKRESAAFADIRPEEFHLEEFAAPLPVLFRSLRAEPLFILVKC